jgi:DMSO/TMAO reductase YedYZ molybdopterin-dependent catalytic subunit
MAMDPDMPTTPDGSDNSSNHPRDCLARQPLNTQVTDRTAFDRYITPTQTHFVRNHYPTPSLDTEVWSLEITGLVEIPIHVTLSYLHTLSSTETVTTTMACAGNGRAAFRPQAAGHQWGVGALSTARWTGVPVREVLTCAGACLDDDCWVAAIGGDAPDDEPVFARSLPMSKLIDDCLLAYEMNGQPLPADHGAPLRLIVPGWYGTNSVKWLTRLHVMETMLCGPEWDQYTHWQQEKYRLVPQGETPTEHTTIETFDTRDQFTDPSIRHPYMYDMLVNSLIITPAPADQQQIEPGESLVIQGVAWAGDDTVASVEVSMDGGEMWHETTLSTDEPAAWQRFTYDWSPRQGTHTLVSRATDDRGRTQPADISAPEDGLCTITDDLFPWNQRGYASNAYLPNAVECIIETN